MKTRVPWNYLPEAFGDDSTANRRLRKWEREGVWERVLDGLKTLGYPLTTEPEPIPENWVLA